MKTKETEMEKFAISQNKKKPLAVVAILCAVGVFLLFSVNFDIPYASFIQLAGVGCLVGAISIFGSSCITGGVEVIFDDRADEVSEYPKLIIRTTKGNHNITGKNIILKFTGIVSLEEGKRTVLKKRKIHAGREYIYANFLPSRVYVIKYMEFGDQLFEIFCDFDSEIAQKISSRMEKYSGLSEDEFGND